MATAIVTTKTSPVEHKVICDALAMYASFAYAMAQRHVLPVPKIANPRHAYTLARNIRAKIGFEEGK